MNQAGFRVQGGNRQDVEVDDKRTMVVEASCVVGKEEVRRSDIGPYESANCGPKKRSINEADDGTDEQLERKKASKRCSNMMRSKDFVVPGSDNCYVNDIIRV